MVWTAIPTPTLASPVRILFPILEWRLGCRLTFIPGAQTRVLREAQAVWRGAGSSWAGAGTRGGGAGTILLAPTTTPELCIQLLPQCLPAGRLRPLTPRTRSARGVCRENGMILTNGLTPLLPTLACPPTQTVALTYQQTQSGCGT